MEMSVDYEWVKRKLREIKEKHLWLRSRPAKSKKDEMNGG
jgi:hypothetical protein